MKLNLRVTNDRPHEVGLLLEPEGMYVTLGAGAEVMVTAECDDDEVIEMVLGGNDEDTVSVYANRRKAWVMRDDGAR
ncbi:MAG: hypothetical protein JNK64_21320 [Myxococcales bacterium]|nr:hypothetical protein [Myxococcales bacterium]